MRTLRLALAQINPTVGDLAGNVAKIREWTERARAEGADVVCFPELAVTGYPPEDLLLRPSFIEDNLDAVRELAAGTRGIVSVVGFVDRQDDIYNAAAVLADGRIAGVYHKRFLPNYGVFDENRYFQEGVDAPVFELGDVVFGVNVCEDIWYQGGPSQEQAHAGASLIININASPYHRGKRAFRERMVATRASDNAVFVAYLNAVGGQDELVFDGGSMIFGPDGELVARAPMFDEDLLITDLHIDAVEQYRLHDPRRRKERLEFQRRDGASRVRLGDFTPPARRPLEPRVEPLPGPVEEVYRALVVGTRDYWRKSGCAAALVGLSGGIDSSMVACIAADALGADNVTGVSMPSRYSSEGSLADARRLADNLGIRLLIVPIEPAHAAYIEMLREPLQSESGVWEENVQARIRGNILMALSNRYGAWVLTTGNKSEYAVGYTTLYGDMAGGFAVLKDVPKTLVYELARWKNATAGREVIPQSVIEKPPSAELRPGQLDTDTLPPYPVLDPILEAYVERDRSPEEIVAMGFDEATVRRVLGMVDRAEYKRRQSPPGVKITPRAFGRDRRLPIVNRYPN